MAALDLTPLLIPVLSLRYCYEKTVFILRILKTCNQCAFLDMYKLCTV